MMQTGCLTAGNPQAGKLNFPILRRRLMIAGEEKVQRKTAARCLFGVPDAIKNKELLCQIGEKRLTDFREKWNFDPASGIPSPLTLTPSTIPRFQKISDQVVGSRRFIWSEIFHEKDPGESGEISIDQSTISRDSLPISSVSVTTTDSDPSSMGRNSAGVSSRRIPCPNPQDAKRFFSGSVLMKQRSITDYMVRVKKPTTPGRIKKGLR